jgi:hypothetical protein
MFRVLVLILVLMSPVVFGQTEDKAPPNPIPEASKLYEFGKATDGYLKMLFSDFSAKLNADPTARGYIINHGTDREIKIRERQIQSAISFLKIDAARVTIVRGGNGGQQETTVWLVPEGAEMPASLQKPHKIDSFGRITESDLKKRIGKFLSSLRNEPAAAGHIIIDGTPAYADGHEKLIRKIMRIRAFSFYRITIARGEVSGKPQTEFWLIPAGATSRDIKRDEN